MSREWGSEDCSNTATKYSQGTPLNPLEREAARSLCLKVAWNSFLPFLFFYDAEAKGKKIKDCITWHVNASPLRAAFVGEEVAAINRCFINNEAFT